MAVVLHILVILLVTTSVCFVKSYANVTSPIMRSVNSTRNASSGGSVLFPVDNLPNPQPGMLVCLLTREGADILNITLECRTVPSYQNISWSIKRAMGTSWENLEAISDERFEVSLKQLRISRVTLQDNGLMVKCLNLCTRINDAYTVTYDGKNMSNEKTCPLRVITNANQTDLNQIFNITCFTDSPKQLHPIVFMWIAIGVFALCVCLVGVLCHISSTKRPRGVRGEQGERGEQGDTDCEPAAGPSSGDAQAHSSDSLGIVYAIPRDICSSGTLSRIQTFLSTKRAASTSIENTSSAEGKDVPPAAVDRPEKPDSSTVRSKPRGVKSVTKKTVAEPAAAGTSSDDVQAHRRDRLGIIYSIPRDLRKSTTLSRIHLLLSTKRAASTSKANEGIDATPAAVDQPDKPETPTMRSKLRSVKTRVKTISGEGWLDDRPYVNV